VEQGGQGGRETVVGEELAASELVVVVAAVVSAYDSAFSSSSLFSEEIFPGKWVFGGD